MERRRFAGLDVVVENAKGTTRHWVDRRGMESGSTEMKHDYGFIEGHVGSDGDDVDCYLGPNEASEFVHVVHQLKSPDFDRHDEDKVMLGFDDEASAKAAYLAHRNDGDRAYGGMTAMPLDAFKRKLERRTGTGKIRHEVTMSTLQMFRIEHRGSRWYVESESGKPMGDYDTEGEARERLRQVEAAKAAKGEELPVGDTARMAMFDATRVDGRVREHVWDFVCVEGWDLKEQQLTEFSPETLKQMIANFVERGDFVAYDWNHQTGYTEKNGKPAPALAFAGAFAAIWDGKVIAHGGARNPYVVEYDIPDAAGRPNGLWAYRCEVTDGSADYPLGQQLLPGFKYVSPMFTSQGLNRHGEEVGYQLIAIAATNAPWQSGTQINFSQPQEGKPMAKLAKLARFTKLEAGAEDKAIRQGLRVMMEDEAVKSMEDDAFKYEEHAAHLEEMAKLYEDAHFEEEEGDEPIQMAARKMAAKFRRMAKLGLTQPADAAPGKAPMHSQEGEHKEPDGDEDGAHGEMAAFAQSLGIKTDGLKKAQIMDAIKAAVVPTSRLPELVEMSVSSAIAKRDEAQRAGENKRQAAVLMDALPKNYPGDRDALKRLAERDPAEALKLAQPFLPKTDVPAHLFSQMSRQGAPVGKGDDARSFSGGKIANKVVNSPMGRFVEVDTGMAAEVNRLADSKDPAEMAKVDALLGASERSIKFSRLVAAGRIVKMERPDLAEDEG
jgi:hypothetical protein